MAKIPRIEQGDRPSATYSPTIDASVQGMVGSIADVSETLLKEATAAERAEQQRMAEALAQKQKIVDESNAGRVSMEFEGDHFKTLAELESGYADTPEKIPALYTEIMRERAEAIRLREDINDNVKLSATKSAESTMSSGLRQAYSISSALQTKQVKGNLAGDVNLIANQAAYLPSVGAVETYAAQQLERVRPMMQTVYGKEASVEEEKLLGDIARRYAANAARNAPLQAGAELKESVFLKRHLSETEHASLVTAADNGYTRLNDTRNMDIAKAAWAAGEKLAASLGTEEFIPAAAERRKALEAEIELARVGRGAEGPLKPADIKPRVANLEAQLKRVKTLQEMNYKQLDLVAVDDPDELRGLVEGHAALTSKIAKNSVKKNLELLETQLDALESARDRKMITPGTYRTMRDKLNGLKRGAVDEQSTNDGWLMFVDAEESGVRELNQKFKTTHSQVSQAVRDQVWVEYTRLVTAAAKQNNFSDAMAIRIAKQVISRKTGIVVTGAFK
jgi:hypothetical protein